jgi:hypothetical protein
VYYAGATGRKERSWVAILIQHVILKESGYEQLKTIDSEGSFGYEANMKEGR